jgi:hypothetical protein
VPILRSKEVTVFKHRPFSVLIVLVLFMSIALAACAPQNESTPEVPTAVASALPEVPTATVTSTSPEIPTAAVTSASPTLSESPLPIAAWDLDGDGTASVGNSTLEFSGAYEFSDTAVAFDGYTGSASTAAPGPIDTTASFSVSAWVNYADRVSDSSQAVSQLGEVSYAFALSAGPMGLWGFTMKTEDRTGGGQYAVRIDGTGAVPSGSWTHLVGIYDKEAGVIRLYVNGKPQAEASFGEPFKANKSLTIGSGQFDSHPGNFWPGAIDEVAVYQSALTAEQVAEIYQTTKPSSPPPPQPAPDPSTYANGILNGTWDYVLSEEDRVLLNADGLEAESGYDADELRLRMGFDNNEWWQGFVFDGELWLINGVPEGDGGTFRIEDDLLIQTGAQGQVQVTYKWVLDGDQLTLTVVEECDITPNGLNCRDDRSQMDPIMMMITEHTYNKSGDDGSY